MAVKRHENYIVTFSSKGDYYKRAKEQQCARAHFSKFTASKTKLADHILSYTVP